MAASKRLTLKNLQNLTFTDAKEVAQEFGKTRFPDFILGVGMVFIGIPVMGLPLGTLCAAALVSLAIHRPVKYENKILGTYGTLLMVAVFYTVMMSLAFGVSSNGEIARRVVRIFIIILLALLIADKRIDFRSLILGVSTGLLANVFAFYAGLNSNNYGGYLTGWLNDKNQAGLWYASVGLLVIMTLRKRNHRVITIILFVILTYLTGSRTAVAALIFGLLWMFLAKYLNIFTKLGLGVFVVWAVDWLTENFANNEFFGDRTGTDALRARIDAAAWDKVQIQPWTGLGYGQATVDIQEKTFFFHNSFWTLWVEGGWIYMLAIISIIIWGVFLVKQPQEKKRNDLNPGSPDNKNYRFVLGEASMVLIFICSWRLGEVILTVPWALSAGVALSYLSKIKNDQRKYQL